MVMALMLMWQSIPCLPQIRLLDVMLTGGMSVLRVFFWIEIRLHHESSALPWRQYYSLQYNCSKKEKPDFFPSYYSYSMALQEVWYYLWDLGTLCVPNHVDYTCSCVTWFGLYGGKFTNSYVALPIARNHLKAKNLWTDSPNPHLCDLLAPWCCPMPSPSGDISYYIITKLMIILGELTYYQMLT